MATVSGYVSAVRLTQWQVKVRLERHAEEITLWRRRLAGQWGGASACDDDMQLALCTVDDVGTVPVVCPGVMAIFAQEGSKDAGNRAIYYVVSVSVPEDSPTHMATYTRHVASWVSTAAREVLPSLAERKSASDIVRGSLKITQGGPSDVATAAVKLLSNARRRVNIRASLEADASKIPGGVNTHEIDNLAIVVRDYDGFRKRPFASGNVTATGGGKRPSLKTVDAFAKLYGVSRQERCVAAVINRLEVALSDGGKHASSTVDALTVECRSEWTGEEVCTAIEHGCSLGGGLARDVGGHVYLKHVYDTEKYVGARIAGLSEGGGVAAWAARIAEATYVSGVHERIARDGQCNDLDEVQRGAVTSGLTGRADVLVVSGFPGSGKSMVSRAIRSIGKALGLVVVACAPTAKAASRLGDGATTVHRALGVAPQRHGESGEAGEFRFVHGPLNPINADIVLVDEASMLDMSLAGSLLRACDPTRTRVVFVGDAHQLPSVDWGDLLRDMMATKAVPRVFLERVYRQHDCTGNVKQNTIWPLARSVSAGGPLKLAEYRSDNVEWIKDESLAGVTSALIRLRTEFGDALQVISPSRRHGLHTVTLNELLVPQSASSPRTAKFVCEDRVVVTRNQQQSTSASASASASATGPVPLMNGDCGVVTGVEIASKKDQHGSFLTICVRLEDGRRGRVSATDLEHSYALTTHKSQGSEYDVVALVLSAEHGRALNREMLYTSITRAKKRLYIFAARDTLATCVTTESEKRRGLLAERIDRTA